MNYILEYNPQVFKDIDHILSFLTEVHDDLPRKFRNLLAGKFEELDSNPERWSPLSNGIRAIRMELSKRLSWYCFYHYYEEDKRILVLRIISQKASTKNWPKG
ncbi:MAG: type II toxin-antitoxin system RelE/ParE family toxin [Bacteroidota bacterium]